MIRTKLAIMVLCAAVARSVAFGATAAEIVERSHEAEKHVNYRGVKNACIWMNGAPTSSVVKIVHMKPDKTRKEYFSPRPVAGSIVILNGSDTWRYRPEGHLWEQIRSPFVQSTESHYDRAFDNYTVRLVGCEKVAGRDAYRIRVLPKRRGEVVRSIWIDKGSYLTLRTEAETVGGRKLSVSGFTTIQIDPKDISASAFCVTGRVRVSDRPPHVTFRIQKPSYLPKGYHLIGLSSMKANAHCAAHLQYSNGANLISLFERQVGGGSAAPRVPRKLTSIMSWTHDGVLLTLISDLPRGELRKIADSTK